LSFGFVDAKRNIQAGILPPLFSNSCVISGLLSSFAAFRAVLFRYQQLRISKEYPDRVLGRPRILQELGMRSKNRGI
jgi:hypothetical protein